MTQKKCKESVKKVSSNSSNCSSRERNSFNTINDEKSDNSGCATVVAFIIVFILILIGISSCSSSGVHTEEELQEAGKWRRCSERTNTYYKCNWNMHEDRCVCKLR